MKSVQEKNKTKKTLLIIAAFLVLLALCALAVYTFVTWKNNPQPSSNTPSTNQQTDASKKSDAANSDKSTSSSTSTPPTPQSDNIKMSTYLDGSGNIIVTTKLYGITDGKCTLTALSGDGASTSYTADVIYQAEYSTCAGFSVPTKQVKGSWKLDLTVESNNVSATQESSVSVQ